MDRFFDLPFGVQVNVIQFPSAPRYRVQRTSHGVQIDVGRFEILIERDQ